MFNKVLYILHKKYKKETFFNSKNVLFFIKYLCLVLSYIYIFYKLNEFKDWDIFFKNFYFFDEKKFFYSSIIIIMTFLSLFLEAFKWQILVRKLEKISLTKSLISVIYGITLSIFTPNRIGDVGGRILVFKKENRFKIIALSIFSNISKLLSIFIIGTFSAIFFLKLYQEKFNFDVQKTILLFIIIAVLFLFLFLLFFKIKMFKKIFFSKFSSFFKILEEIKLKILSIILFLSLLKSLVGIIQFYLLLLFFHVNINFLTAVLCIALTNLLITILPSNTLSEISLRGSVSIFLFSKFVKCDVYILFASFTLWIINLALPSIFASLHIKKNDIKNSSFTNKKQI